MKNVLNRFRFFDCKNFNIKPAASRDKRIVENNKYNSFRFSIYKNRDIKIIVIDVPVVDKQVISNWKIIIDKMCLLKHIIF